MMTMTMTTTMLLQTATSELRSVSVCALRVHFVMFHNVSFGVSVLLRVVALLGRKFHVSPTAHPYYKAVLCEIACVHGSRGGAPNISRKS